MCPIVADVLQFLKEYLQAYVQATKSIKRSDVRFLDVCAGPGFDRSRDTGDIIEGSPQIATSIYPGFRRFLLLDINPAYTRQLNQLALERGHLDITHVFTGDCNDIIEQPLRLVPQDGATFCFVDPAWIHVYWTTVRAIADHKRTARRKIELFILFPYDMALVRFLALEKRPEEIWGTDVEGRIDAMMPDSIKSRRVYEARREGSINATEARRRFAYTYWMGLKNLGYEHVLNPRLLRTRQGRPLYFLFFASDHDAGERIMSHVLTKPRSFDQLSFPTLDDPWTFGVGEDWYEAHDGNE